MLSDVVGDQIRRVRQQLGMTREELVKRCADRGWDGLTYGVMGTIESGRKDKDGVRKREISVDELVVIAHALGVPPVLLIAPLGYEDEVEVLPGELLETLAAYEYLIGGTTAANTDQEDGQGSFVIRAEPALAVRVYRDYSDAVLRYMGARLDGDEPKARRAWADLLNAQRTMQEAGFRIPPLPGQSDPDQEEGNKDG